MPTTSAPGGQPPNPLSVAFLAQQLSRTNGTSLVFPVVTSVALGVLAITSARHMLKQMEQEKSKGNCR